jgi:hypothetical protein
MSDIGADVVETGVLPDRECIQSVVDEGPAAAAGGAAPRAPRRRPDRGVRRPPPPRPPRHAHPARSGAPHWRLAHRLRRSSMLIGWWKLVASGHLAGEASPAVTAGLVDRATGGVTVFTSPRAATCIMQGTKCTHATAVCRRTMPIGLAAARAAGGGGGGHCETHPRLGWRSVSSRRAHHGARSQHLPCTQRCRQGVAPQRRQRRVGGRELRRRRREEADASCRGHTPCILYVFRGLDSGPRTHHVYDGDATVLRTPRPSPSAPSSSADNGSSSICHGGVGGDGRGRTPYGGASDIVKARRRSPRSRRGWARRGTAGVALATGRG